MMKGALLKMNRARQWQVASGDDAEFYLSLWSWSTAKVKKSPCWFLDTPAPPTPTLPGTRPDRDPPNPPVLGLTLVLSPAIGNRKLIHQT